MEKRKLRGGMIGGGIGAFIGPVHRMAAILDGQAEFVAGAFSSDPEKSLKSGAEIFIAAERTYKSYQDLLANEQNKAADQRLDFISIVTPNSTHFEIAKACLEAGFNVICDKPMTMDLAQAKALKEIVVKSGKVFALTHNYTGYPMVKQAKFMIANNQLGKINKIVVSYPQGWLSGCLDDSSKASEIWRLNSDQAGATCCMGDIGTHAENLARYMTGLEIDQLCADLTSFVGTDQLDNDGNVLIHYKGGARGVLFASQISTGEENGLNIKVYGSKKGLSWNQEDPNYLIVKDPTGFETKYSKGNECLCPEAQAAGRLPFGHPDGFIEAFANIYCEAYKAIRAEINGIDIPKCDYPDVEDGIVGMAFIETLLKSANSEEKWTQMIK